MPRYNPQAIEKKWQAYWAENETFRSDFDTTKDKLYVLDMFPYPSGSGLHVGHPVGYTATDIITRHARMCGKNVLHPMGWDAFGLPAEQHAIETGEHPAIETYKNIDTFRRQLQTLGFSYDWSREFATTDPDYFRWTQWIFLQLFDTWYDPHAEWTDESGREHKGKGRPIAELPIPQEIETAGEAAVRKYQDSHRLAYQSDAPVNWCPALGTVLANEEVTADGRSDRGNHPVERRALRQWMLRITAYAERLLADLDDVAWSESIKLLQRNWIGKSIGAEVDFFIGLPCVSDVDNSFQQWQADRKTAGFPTEADEDVLRIYTTRPDTLFGATYMVLAPEHPFVERLTTDEQKDAVDAYCRQAAHKSDLDRTDLAKEKTGVFTGSYAVNPVNGEQVPIWIADYVLISYGTGAIMAVPAHDLRDWEFAVTFGLELKEVVATPKDHAPTKEEQATFDAAMEKGLSPIGFAGVPFSGWGTAINSGEFNGTPSEDFKPRITAWLADRGMGQQAVNYRLRDWLFSRQRYWGEPFPIWHEVDENGEPTGLIRPVSEDELPVELPEMEDFKPKGTPEPPLSFAPDEWLYREAEDGTRLKRETNSMPQWAGSCWYYLRFADPKNSEKFIDSEAEKYWLPVDIYIGGAEHAVLHLLYSRFWHKVLYDRGHVSTSEPFHRLVNQGMILGEPELTGFARADGSFVSAKAVKESESADGEKQFVEESDERPVSAVKFDDEQVEKHGDDFVLIEQPEIVVQSRAFKMSKSRGNVINPDDIVDGYGADSLRLYEMFMSPLDQLKPWSMSGVEGIRKFLGRVWRMVIDDKSETDALHPGVNDTAPSEEQERLLHKTIKAVSEDIESLSFNTAISRMMEFTNAMTASDSRPKSVLEPFVLLLSPFAPHLAEELWQQLGHSDSLCYHPWPQVDESKLVESTIEVPVQVNGKLRARLQLPVDADKAALQAAAEADEAIAKHLEGKQIVKVVVVPGRLVNFVVRG